jgi:hypothetical protein
MIFFNPFKKNGVYITFCNNGVVFKLYFKDISSVADFMHSFLNSNKK